MDDDANAIVFDSFALLAYLGGEPAMERVKQVLRQAATGRWTVFLSIISLGEVLYITERERGITRAHAVLAAIDRLPLQILPANREDVLAAAHIKARFPLSYADAFVAAVAQSRQAVIFTGDPEFRHVEGMVTVEWLPQA